MSGRGRIHFPYFSQIVLECVPLFLHPDSAMLALLCLGQAYVPTGLGERGTINSIWLRLRKRKNGKIGTLDGQIQIMSLTGSLLTSAAALSHGVGKPRGENAEHFCQMIASPNSKRIGRNSLQPEPDQA